MPALTISEVARQVGHSLRLEIPGLCQFPIKPSAGTAVVMLGHAPQLGETLQSLEHQLNLPTHTVNRVLLHPECHDRVHRLRIPVSKPRLAERGVRRA